MYAHSLRFRKFTHAEDDLMLTDRTDDLITSSSYVCTGQAHFWLITRWRSADKVQN